MVSVTSLGRDGLTGWLIQRVSAILLGAYALGLILFFTAHPQLNFEQWHGLFSQTWMKVATLVVLLNLLAHAWIGLWTVITDYINCSSLRVVTEVSLIIGLLGLMGWGLIILL